jgi:bifunctional NMN adenylyltransferase/nudix hydrolase
MTKQFDQLIFILRGQPIHNSHVKILEYAAQNSKQVLVIFGSIKQPRTYKNPFTFQERSWVLTKIWNELQLGEKNSCELVVRGVVDTLYNENKWIQSIQEASTAASKQKLVSDEYEIGIIGHNKDESSYYLKEFPQWEQVEVPRLDNLSSTDIRELYFKELNNLSFIEGVVPEQTYEFLNSFRMTADFTAIVRERQFIEKYKKQYEAYPYPPTFVTADACVVQSGHVLMVTRRSEPGAGLYALPGGFLDANTDKSLVECMIRELREETSIRVPPAVLRGSIKQSKVFDAISRSTRGRTITHAFHIELNEDELPKVRYGSDAANVQWIPLSNISSERCFEDHWDIINYFVGPLK